MKVPQSCFSTEQPAVGPTGSATIERLAEKRRVLAPDLPGFGDSGLPPGLDSAKQLADQTVAAIDVLLDEGTKVDLVGFSFGAIVAGLAAARLGRRVPRLGLIGAGGIGMSGRVPELENDILDPRDPAATERAELARFMFASPTAADDCALMINRQNIERARFKSGSIPASTLLLEALPAVTAEIHALYSDRDAFGVSEIDEKFPRLAAARNDIHFHTIVGAGHWSPYGGLLVFWGVGKKRVT